MGGIMMGTRALDGKVQNCNETQETCSGDTVNLILVDADN